MTTKSKIPKIRFKKFSGEWDEKKLGEVAKVYDGTHSTPNYVNNGVQFYSVEHLTANQFIKTKYITEEVFEKENNRVKLEKNDILMTRIGDIGTSRLLDWDVKASFYVSLALIKQSSLFNSTFLNQYIKFDGFQNELWNKTIHVAFPKKINLGEIGNCKINLPQLPEQQKIASFLSLFDEKIENIKEKKKALEEYKKGVMQKILKQEIRFKDENGEEFGEWEEKEFNEVLESISTKQYQIYNTEILESGDFKVVDQGKNKIAGFSNNKEKVFKESPVIIFGDHTTVLKYIDFNFVVGADGTKILKNKEGNLYYLYNYLLLNNIESEGYKRHFSILKEINIFLPSLPEQEKIADFLSGIDEKIEKMSDELGKMEEFKKGLLQGMFV